MSHILFIHFSLDGHLGLMMILVFILHVCMLSHSVLSETPWTVIHQASWSMGASRQEYWSGLPCPPPGDLPKPETESTSPASPALADRVSTEPPGKPLCLS